MTDGGAKAVKAVRVNTDTTEAAGATIGPVEPCPEARKEAQIASRTEVV